MAIAKRSRTELGTQRFEYAPAPESTDHVKIEKRYDLFIGGRMVKAHSQKRFPTINPSNEEKLSEVVEADEVDRSEERRVGKSVDLGGGGSSKRKKRSRRRAEELRIMIIEAGDDKS